MSHRHCRDARCRDAAVAATALAVVAADQALSIGEVLAIYWFCEKMVPFQRTTASQLEQVLKPLIPQHIILVISPQNSNLPLVIKLLFRFEK